MVFDLNGGYAFTGTSQSNDELNSEKSDQLGLEMYEYMQQYYQNIFKL